MRRPRWTVRASLGAVLLVALGLGAYVTLVRAPLRRRQFRAADDLVTLQIRLLRDAAAFEARGRHDAEDAADGAFQQAGDVSIAAGQLRFDAPERIDHERSLKRWADAAEINLSLAVHLARRSEDFRRRAVDLTAKQTVARNDFDAMQRLGAAADAWFDTVILSPGPSEDWPYQLRTTANAQYVEAKARGGRRTTFPTVAGPRGSAIEATAIWQAEEMFRSLAPELLLARCRVELVGSPDAFCYKVRFIDPETGRTGETHTSFSPSTVLLYLAKHP